jgi:signal transduction histidine kinase
MDAMAPERSAPVGQKLASSKPSPLLVLLVRSPDFLLRTPVAYRLHVGVATSALIVLLLGAADFLSPRDITYSIFYLFPISFSAWAFGKRPGLSISTLATITWLTAEAHGRPDLKGWILVWNTISRFGVFAFIVLLIAELRQFTDRLAQLVEDRTHRLETETAQRIAIEREIAAISDREQKRISHELHDGLGQHLAGLAFRSKALEQRLAARQVPETTDATELTLLIRSAVAQVRVLARGLDPIEIEGGDLIAALQSLARETQRTFQIPCEFQAPPTAGLRLDRHVGLALYRITQEAIHNALEHGHARNLEIHLDVDDPRPSLKTTTPAWGSYKNNTTAPEWACALCGSARRPWGGDWRFRHQLPEPPWFARYPSRRNLRYEHASPESRRSDTPRGSAGAIATPHPARRRPPPRPQWSGQPDQPGEGLGVLRPGRYRH